jgi:DNA polymerase Ligase (LigD)
MPRFVILEHDYPERHWDLMLEAGPALRTWRLLGVPQAGQVVPAEPSFDHRTVYLDYEGPVSGGRGQVQRWDHGTFTWEADEENRVTFHLNGGRLKGRARLKKDPDGVWTFVCVLDDRDRSPGVESGNAGSQGEQTSRTQK